jgi:hypothetical protein
MGSQNIKMKDKQKSKVNGIRTSVAMRDFTEFVAT